MLWINRSVLVGLGVLLCNSATAQSTELVSMSSNGEAGPGSASPSISADGRFVVFSSLAPNLVPGDTNGKTDIFVRDRQSHTTSLVSVASDGGFANDESWTPCISADGRFVAFQSWATNIAPGATNGEWEIYVRDLQNGTTEWVSPAAGGGQPDSPCMDPSISGDGRYVSFDSQATNLVPGGTNTFDHIYVRDRQTMTTAVATVGMGGSDVNGASVYPTISTDGRYVAYVSGASNLAPGDTNDREDIYRTDLQAGTTELSSVSSAGLLGNSDSWLSGISADGRFVVFRSAATNLVSGDTNGFPDVFVRDHLSGTTERVSVGPGGVEGNGDSGDGVNLSITPDGRYVVFSSLATNLVSGSPCPQSVYLCDRQNGLTERVSVNSGGAPPNGPSTFSSVTPDGRFVAFESTASNLVPGGIGFSSFVYVRDRLAGSGSTAFTSLCGPGTAGVTGCPCSNPPSGADRGCDNSYATGGAALSAAGGASVTADGLVFSTSGQSPTGLSVVMQGTAAANAGMVYGQGVRCVAGALKRLYVKDALGGAITAPDWSAGDIPVSTRSAQRGDHIQPGQSRWYLVYYRDPIVLGGCPATSTFNATQSGRVNWSF